MTITQVPVTNPRDNPDNANLPTSNQPATIIGTTVAFLSIAFLTLSLRLWVRIKDRLWGWDDSFVVLAGIASFCGDIIVCIMPGDGLGLHLWTLDAEHLMLYFKHIYSTNAAYCASATLIKLAILFQYLRLFAEAAPSTTTNGYRLARRLIWGMIVICTLWGLTFFLLAVFSCRPIAKNWNMNLPGRCIGWGSKDPAKFFPMFLGHSVSNLVLDTMVLLLPVPFITALRIAGKSRAGLIGLFILGSTVVFVALGRLITLVVNRAGTLPNLDMSFHTPVVYIFAVLEVNFAIITASIPIFWPVIATLASNKIFVVNEVEIHVEDIARHESFDSSGAISLPDRKGTPSGDSKNGMVTTILDHIPRRSGEKLSSSDHGRDDSAASSINQPMGTGFVGRKASNASTMGRSFAELGSRPSQDSSRHLYQDHSSKNLTKNNGDDWFAEMDRSTRTGR
ncbi:hypothetical protein COCC4DRAFT_137122 [Bipolaris maydis ATCC 48331]|uniref:Rhodopsin domain-containing protein n=2 Tax=Cochliobolus heterostrophus TaxID=5016 RepID=M2ULR4_COCH5|nr:uncharacterized protein COCC4DRAFT_137122 [Bipolaris maydis ATCC 48331]EMD88857.1 hypothetical protein COCHEDRAFT_1226951 [Bipolaris maydis C5]KAJ5028569.1 hypothetical protein J3E73DRAFT_379840 [Bipolaris maydis]ENI05427.1 hypothetical protein COCC4DRAFT_137122 [Bipolaris maydis ATCC 48331]KAJ5063349.1 hypothetical protein J3E74DRAFT_237885 [Bipolaris maydis]KAJ6205783.1 hypothetical protein PSV09DRAFT_1226951 [Bipolaris maydis]